MYVNLLISDGHRTSNIVHKLSLCKPRIAHQRRICKCYQKIRKVAFFNIGHRQFVLQRTIQIRLIGVNARSIMIDNLPNREETAIVHIRVGECDIAQRRYFEFQ